MTHSADLCNTSSGYTDGSSNLRRPDRAGRRHPQPDAAGARAPRAHGLGVVRRPAAAAIHGQPAPQDSARRRVGILAPRRHEPLLHAGARRSGAGDPPALGAASRAGQPDPRRRSGRPAPSRRPRPAADQVAGVLRVRRRSMGPPAPGHVRPRVPSAGAPGTARPRMGRRRSRMRHGPGRRGARAVREAGHRRRSLERHAGRRPSPGPRSSERRRAAR